MKVHVIGAGVIGLATGRGFARFGHEVLYSDTDSGVVSRCAAVSVIHPSRWAIPEAAVHFVCTPEDAAPDVVRRLVAENAHGLIVIRSSVPPGTTRSLAAETNRMLFHNPEFLKEVVADDDFLWADYSLIGWSERMTHDTSYEEAMHVFHALYGPMGIQGVPCSSTESELVKLLTNNHLATLISFWNEMALICRQLKLNSHKVSRLVAMDTRVSNYGAYKHGAPYGGRCLPKDVEQVLAFARDLPTPILMPLLEAVGKVNKSIGGD